MILVHQPTRGIKLVLNLVTRFGLGEALGELD
jgi:hypothetical protein